VAGLAVAVLVAPGRARLTQIAGATAGIGALMMVIVNNSQEGLLADRFSSILNPTADTVETADGDRLRQQLWDTSIHVFLEHPVTGVGDGNLPAILLQRVANPTIYTHAHSTYLRFLAEAGILGGLALAVLAVAVLRDLRRALSDGGRANPVIRGIAGACVVLAVVCLTDDTVRYPAVFACALVPIVLAAAVSARRVVGHE
jgi:O-antigen ligase